MASWPKTPESNAPCINRAAITGSRAHFSATSFTNVSKASCATSMRVFPPPRIGAHRCTSVDEDGEAVVELGSDLLVEAGIDRLVCAAPRISDGEVDAFHGGVGGGGHGRRAGPTAMAGLAGAPVAATGVLVASATRWLAALRKEPRCAMVMERRAGGRETSAARCSIDHIASRLRCATSPRVARIVRIDSNTRALDRSIGPRGGDRAPVGGSTMLTCTTRAASHGTRPRVATDAATRKHP